MERCRCGRDQRFGETWCPVCGARFGVGVAGLGPGAVPPPGRPGTVVAAQIVLGLGAAGNAVLALYAAVGLIGALSVATYTGMSPVLVLLAALVYCLATLGFDVWAALAVGKGNRTARLLATVVPAVTTLLDVVMFVVTGSDVGPSTVTVVLSMAHAAALAILLWVPEASRRYFGDAVPARPAPYAAPSRPTPSGTTPSGPIPAPYRPTPTPAPGLSFTQNPTAIRVPSPAPAPDDDATTVTLRAPARSVAPTSVATPVPSPRSSGPASVPTPSPSTRSAAPTLVPSAAHTAAPATPPGGRHRVPDVP